MTDDHQRSPVQYAEDSTVCVCVCVCVCVRSSQTGRRCPWSWSSGRCVFGSWRTCWPSRRCCGCRPPWAQQGGLRRSAAPRPCWREEEVTSPGLSVCHSLMHAHSCTLTLTHAHSHTRSLSHTLTLTHTHSHTCSLTHSYTHTLSRSHTHFLIQVCVYVCI